MFRTQLYMPIITPGHSYYQILLYTEMSLQPATWGNDDGHGHLVNICFNLLLLLLFIGMSDGLSHSHNRVLNKMIVN